MRKNSANPDFIHELLLGLSFHYLFGAFHTGEAALWLVLHSPSAGIGPYAKVDIGAGTLRDRVF